MLSIGTGIAIAGVWIFAGIVGTSRYVTSGGFWAAIMVAIIMTLVLK